MSASRWESRFLPGDRVVIDGDPSLVGVATAFLFRPERRPSGCIATVEVSYVHNGDAKTTWVEEWRLEKAP